MINGQQQDELTKRIWRQLGRVVAAHVLALADEGIIDEEASASLLSALDNVARGTPGAGGMVGLLTDFDARLDAVSPPGVHGAAGVSRGTADVVAAVARLIVRDDLLALAAGLERLTAGLVDLAAGQTVSLMPAFSHGQAAQPTTLGHYLGGLIGPLMRAGDDLRATYDVVNRSPVGAGDLASSAVEVDRGHEAELLGFAGVVDNTFDAVAAVDYFARCSDVAAAIASTAGRYLRDLLIWWRSEPAIFRLTDDWLAHDPKLPQLVAPVRIESLTRDASRISRGAAALRALVDDVPYAPATGVTDDLLRQTDALLHDTTELTERLVALMTGGLEFNRALLANRAGRSFSTISDLTDFLMIEEQLEPATARAIAGLTYSRATEYGVEASGITAEMIDGAAMLVLGRELKVEFEAISRYLAPRRFIERRTATGAPSPAATRAWLDRVRDSLADDLRWRETEEQRLAAEAEAVDRRLSEAPA